MTEAKLGAILAFVAGATNAGGFLAVGYYTSHMTGIVSSIADYIVIHQLRAALFAFAYFCAFIAGATLSTLIINMARAHHHPSDYGSALLTEAMVLLMFGGLVTGFGLHNPLFPPPVIIGLLCFVMGLQNALITKISQARIRTTHVTGITTDIGIELGRYLYQTTHRDQPAIFHPRRLGLHLSLLLAFITGGLVGAFSFKWIGFGFTIPLALMLTVVAFIPLAKPSNP